jgi:hypothetical protein
MIYYTDYGKVVNTIEGEDYELKECVALDPYDGVLKKDDWGTGCLYEGDEFFQSFCMMKYGFQPIMLEDEEYNVFKACGIVYFSKARKLRIREILSDFRRKENEKSR